MIVMFVVVLVALLSVIGLAVAIRHFQLLGQLAELDRQIEQLIDQLGLLETDYFIECELDSLIRKQDSIRQKMFF